MTINTSHYNEIKFETIAKESVSKHQWVGFTSAHVSCIITTHMDGAKNIMKECENTAMLTLFSPTLTL